VVASFIIVCVLVQFLIIKWCDDQVKKDKTVDKIIGAQQHPHELSEFSEL